MSMEAKDVIINDIPVHIKGNDFRHTRKKKKKSPMGLGIKRMSKRQKRAMQNFFEQGMRNKKKAALDARYSPKTSNVINTILKRKPIVLALESKGITDEKIADTIADGFEAMHPFRPKQKDHNVRIKYVMEANRCKDNYPAKKIEVDDRTVVLHLTAQDYRAIKEYSEIRGEDGSIDTD